MFNADAASLPDVLSQPSGDYACFSPHLDFPATGALSPGLVRAGLISAAACVGPPGGGPRGLPTTPPFGAPPSPASATSSSRRSSDKAAGLTRLRTSRKHGRDAAAAKPGKAKLAAEEKQSASRESHNQVEKKYRDRLNDQFERLLATLALSSKSDPDTMDDDSQRPLSKSAVLGLARRRLLVLEKENRQLGAEVERLTALLERIG